MSNLQARVTPRMSLRMTRDALRVFCDELNELLNSYEIDYVLKSESRNGYVAVDLYDTTGCIENLTAGTPRECANEAERFALTVLVNDARTKAQQTVS